MRKADILFPSSHASIDVYDLLSHSLWYVLRHRKLPGIMLLLLIYDNSSHHIIHTPLSLANPLIIARMKAPGRHYSPKNNEVLKASRYVITFEGSTYNHAMTPKRRETSPPDTPTS